MIPLDFQPMYHLEGLICVSSSIHIVQRISHLLSQSPQERRKLRDRRHGSRAGLRITNRYEQFMETLFIAFSGLRALSHANACIDQF